MLTGTVAVDITKSGSVFQVQFGVASNESCLASPQLKNEREPGRPSLRLPEYFMKLRSRVGRRMKYCSRIDITKNFGTGSPADRDVSRGEKYDSVLAGHDHGSSLGMPHDA